MNLTVNLGSLIVSLLPLTFSTISFIRKTDENDIVGDLERGVSGGFARTIFFFLRADHTASCVARVTGQPVNHGDMLGMKVPCKIRLTGRPQFLRILEAQIKDM